MQLRSDARAVIVSGAAKGIGRAVAKGWTPAFAGTSDSDHTFSMFQKGMISGILRMPLRLVR